MKELEYDTSEELGTTLDNSDIRIHAEFVPWSQSRKFNGTPAGEAKPQDMSLNWRVTLKVGDREVLITDYTAGIGHCPSYTNGWIRNGFTLEQASLIRHECEKGKPATIFPSSGAVSKHKSKPILPKPEDVLHSLLLDSDAIEHDSFESWASDFGYDEDSRKAETLYRECLEIGLKLRNAFGDTRLQELRDLFQDY